ncbi:predicted protein [Streptomyces viridochromogenes DSM 40736]|uniref:Predicted protein n=1 Tax=Streptomyces viridochromogenes (strain DSM 40736 / JCM 4977 / BCRC 1201 / Tue 494) TaxID=591159 RepID=D9X362_STRVT|nr:predicted protein [Streptomyces viridochromogenes DSM 40736]
MRIAEGLVPATAGGTFQVKKRIGSYPRVRVEGGGRGVVSQAGAVLLVETVRKSGLNTAGSPECTRGLGPLNAEESASRTMEPTSCFE